MDRQPVNQDTKTRIAECFKALVVEKGFEKLKVREITDRAGLTRPTFYTYFKDKYEIIEYIFETEVAEPVRPFLDKGFLRESVLYFLVQLEKDKAFYREISQFEGQNSFADCLRRTAVDGVRRYMGDKIKSQERGLYTTENMARYFSAMVEFIVVRWLRQRDPELTTNMAMEIYDLLMMKSPYDLLNGNI